MNHVLQMIPLSRKILNIYAYVCVCVSVTEREVPVM